MNEVKPRICVIGAGKWGLNHIRTVAELNALSGIIDKNKKLLLQLKQKFSCAVFSDLDDISFDSFDAFIIATPPKSHYSIAKKIINKGKPVLVEKPLTLDLLSAKKINDLAKKNNVNLMVGHLLLFHPAFRKMKDIINKGIIGEIQYIYSNRLNHGTFRSDENVFWSFAPHDISLFNYFFEEKPIDIHSHGTDILQAGVHDTTITSFKYDKNKMGHIFVSWLHPFKEHRFVIIGSKGMIHFEDSIEDKPLTLHYKKARFINSIPTPEGGEIEKINYDNTEPLRNELRYFISNIFSEKINIANGDSAVDVIRILEKSTESLKSLEANRKL
tara:strand:+ start:2682 stop:3668 length:987 start_codon:yes stop_codon:yes gene_type:complete